jgi:hypothetical protein
MKNLFNTFTLTIALILLLSLASFAGTKDIGNQVRYKGVFYTVVYEGSNYTVLINEKNNTRKIVNFK